MGTLGATSPHSLILVCKIPLWPLVKKVRRSWGLRVAAEEQLRSWSAVLLTDGVAGTGEEGVVQRGGTQDRLHR